MHVPGITWGSNHKNKDQHNSHSLKIMYIQPKETKIPPCIDHIILLSSEQVHLLRRVKLRKSNKCKQIFRILILYQNVSLNFLNILFPPLWITIYYSTAFINNSFLNIKHLLISPLSILTDAIYQGTYFPALFCILFGSFHPIIFAAFSVDGDYSYNTPVLKFSTPLIYKGIYFYSTYKIQRYKFFFNKSVLNDDKISVGNLPHSCAHTLIPLS